MAALRYGLVGGSARVWAGSIGLDGSLSGLGDLVLGDDDPLGGDLRFLKVLAVGDMDKDGREDFVAVTANLYHPSPNILSVFYHQGNLNFSLDEYPACRGDALDLQLADVNNDGRLDAVLVWGADVTDLDQDGALDVMIQLPTGAMAAPVRYKVGTGPVRAVVAELDGRPGLDIAVACDSSNEVTILLNDGQGSFPAQERYFTGGGTDGLAIADFDGDGWPDVGVVHEDDDLETAIEHNASVTILRGLNPLALPAPRILAFRPVGQDVVLRFDGLVNPANYTVERTLDLANPGWKAVGVFPGTTTEWRMPQPGPQSFYRIVGRR